MGRKRKGFIKLPTSKQWDKMLFGSDRPGHLFAAFMVGVLVITAGYYVGRPWLWRLGLGVWLWEWACTPDVDDAWRRKPDSIHWALICLLWIPYSWAVPHRNKFSHSLIFGTTCRLLYVVLALALLSLVWREPFQFAVGDAWQLSRASGIPTAIALLWGRWSNIVAIAVVGDITHMLKDGYGPLWILFGKPKKK